jgi:hypothetical protein
MKKEGSAISTVDTVLVVGHWPMAEAVIYGGGALWVATLRFVACLNPKAT